MNRYYKILGLQPGASKEDVKRAYRKMAMRHHPDKNPGNPAAAEKFRQILEAYEFLTGYRKRTQTNQLSEEELRKIRDLMKKAAEEKAKAKYRERVSEFRKEQEQEQAIEYQRGIFALAALLIVAFAVWRGFDFYKNLMIDGSPVTVEAEVTSLAQNRIIYEFPVGEEIREDKKYVSGFGIIMLAGNGMPLRKGDRFELTFSAKKPGLNRINYQKVSTATMRRYFSISARRVQYIYYDDWKNLSQPERNLRSTCIVLQIFEKEGFDGLASLIFSEANPFNNFSHNWLTWRFAQKSDWFTESVEHCRKLENYTNEAD